MAQYNALDMDVRVRIKDLKIEGVIYDIWIPHNGVPQYKIRYFYNGDLKETYLLPNEFEIINTETRKVGPI